MRSVTVASADGSGNDALKVEKEEVAVTTANGGLKN